jgi:23S rRNA (pseudouridine1915-N3)-methyltransferase
MKVHLAWITPKPGRSKEPEIAKLVGGYLSRAGAYGEVGTVEAAGEDQLFAALEKLAGRTRPYLVLLDSRGKTRTSEEVAEIVRNSRDNAVQHLVFAIGGADGWSEAACKRANELLSFGRITLPHELARLVMAEQIYRAFTILAGHPYHGGH